MQKAGMVIDRRTMLRGAGSAGVAGMANFGAMSASIAKAISAEPQKGWQEGPMRWFQLAFTEDDPTDSRCRRETIPWAESQSVPPCRGGTSRGGLQPLHGARCRG